MEQVESCLPDNVTTERVIDVATVLLVKTAILMVENVPIDKVSEEVASMSSHVLGNIATNVKRALIRKQLRAIAPKDPLSAQDLGIFKQLFESHEGDAN